MQQLFVQDESDDEALQAELSRQVEETINSSQNNLKPINNGNIDINGEENEPEKEDIEPEKPLYPLIPNEPPETESLKPNLDDIRAVEINLTLSLKFQQEVVENALVSEDPLVIMGKGLGMASIVANLLHILATPTTIDGQLKRSLVLVLNARNQDNQRISEELQELSWISSHPKENNSSVDDDGFQNERPFSVVTADSLSVDKRRKLYLSGGIISVTSRILIVDLLSGIVHPNRITGMVVLNVENLRHYCNESFIVEMYRSKNKWGFIKGFSESPESFVMEFSPLMRKMKELKLKNVLLWPRFRVEVSSCLNNTIEQQNNKVIEVKVSTTNSMSQIQFGLMECLKKCIAELNRKNPELALEWWDIENALNIHFLRSIDSVMIPNWHRISYESKQLVKDIRFLKNLMKLLIRADAVDFYEEVQLSLDANKPQMSRKYSESPWLMADESQLVISYARKRIFDKEEYSLEEQPKWEQLINIIDDIAHERVVKDISGPTLIMCSDTSTCIQLTRILNSSDRVEGFRRIMMQKLQMYKEHREERKTMVREVKEKTPEVPTELNVSQAFAKDQVTSKRRRTRGSAAVAAVERLRTAGTGESIETVIDGYDLEREMSAIDDGIADDVVIKYENEISLEDANVENIPDTFNGITKEIWEQKISEFEYVNCGDEIIIEKFSNVNDDALLQEIMPSYIIMYEPDLDFIRKVEIYRATHKDLPPKVYFMYYGDSVEEQTHLTAIKKEKDAFTKLIRENAMLANHFETDEDLSHYKNLTERKLKMSRLRNASTRMAGGQAALQEYTQDVVIVDSREFNASLPGLLYRYNVRVVPCMLTVGDYIISPDICIERKSIADLIGSLQNNRLVSQCKKMSKHYKYPALLIEFDEGQSFSLEPFSERRSYRSKELSTTHSIASKLSQDDIQLKLCKIVMRFPTLKIIWSSSPLQTVNILLELKFGREQPDPSKSVQLGAGTKEDIILTNTKDGTQKDESDKYHRLLQIPGISKVDYFTIRKRVKSYKKLKGLTSQELSDLLGDADLASRIYNYIQREEEMNHTDESDDSEFHESDDELFN